MQQVMSSKKHCGEAVSIIINHSIACAVLHLPIPDIAFKDMASLAIIRRCEIDENRG